LPARSHIACSIALNAVGGDEPLTGQRLATLTIELDLERRASVDQRKESLELFPHARRVAGCCVRKAERI
jgi:hypothetical protein